MKWITRTAVLLWIFSLFLPAGCAQPETEPETQSLLITAVPGSGGGHKADAPFAITQWEIREGAGETLVFQGLSGGEHVYLDAIVRREGTAIRMVFLEPVQCTVITDPSLGLVVKNTCDLEETAILGVTATDFIQDYAAHQKSGDAAQKADGIGTGTCAAAEVIVGGLAGVVTTVILFHEALIEAVYLGLFGWSVGITATGVSLGVAAFALSAVGAAWGVDMLCEAMGIGHHFSSTLAVCVSECDEDDDVCIFSCVSEATTDDGIALGLLECEDACEDDATCFERCDEAFGSEDTLRQTLVMQCVMGCPTGDDRCANDCVNATNAALPF